jgi:hypothetical protein
VRDMEKIIYVVTRGSYSDYSIVAVFDDEALADEFVKHHNEDKSGWWDDAIIEAYECNPNESALREGMMNYSVRIWEDNEDDTEVNPTVDSTSQPEERKGARCRLVDMVVSAKNAEHAAKIGTEKRAVWLVYGVEAIGGKMAD